jgi:xylono-1,5-lactonase
MSGEPRSVWSLAAELGEGPVWVDGTLWFVDIKQRKVHSFRPSSGKQRSWDAPEEVGFVLPRRAGGFVAGLESGLFAFDPDGGAFEPIVEVEAEHPGNRINDGVVDADGRLWFGTMDNRERDHCGAFYRYAAGRLEQLGPGGICITNGPAISPDMGTLYCVDTLAGTIAACDLHPDGSPGSARPFVSIAREDGYPDGPTVDSEGCLWVGLYAGWEARRYSPAGELLERVKFPVANITKIAFGGDDLRTAYATTARQKLTPEEIAPQPQIGDLFEFRVDVPGLPCPLIDA